MNHELAKLAYGLVNAGSLLHPFSLLIFLVLLGIGYLFSSFRAKSGSRIFTLLQMVFFMSIVFTAYSLGQSVEIHKEWLALVLG